MTRAEPRAGTSAVAEAGTGALGPSPALRLRHVSKMFPGVRALEDVTFELDAGELRGLVGENGSGKSTLMRIVAGDLVPDAGSQVEIFGQPLTKASPIAAQRLGVGLIPQELMVAPKLSVLENVFLGDYAGTWGIVRWRVMADEYERLSAEMGVRLAPRVIAEELSLADLTMVEIMRAVRRQARILLMDEPTAALGRSERERLYELLARMREAGRTVVFISHDLDEVLALSDSVTVLRDRQHVRTAPRSQWDKAEIVAGMLGAARARKLGERSRDRPAPQPQTTWGSDADAPPTPILTVRKLSVPGALHDVDFDVMPGEVLGLAGLVGSGRSTLLRAVAGLVRPAAGELEVDGKPVPWPRSIRRALLLGIAMLPEERRTEGLILGMPVYDNVVLTDLRRVSDMGFFLRNGEGRAKASGPLKNAGFRGRSTVPVGTLSGGNQQKVVLAKWLFRRQRVLLVDEPTRGIDVQAKQEVLRAVRALAGDGAGIVFVSSELEEVAEVADRVLVVSRRGEICRELSYDAVTVENMLNAIFGVEAQT